MKQVKREGKTEESYADIINKLKSLNEHDRQVWLDKISFEFYEEVRRDPYLNGYAQGKFEGSLDCNKVILTKEQAEIFEKLKSENDSIYDFLGKLPHEEDVELFARAYLDSYELKEEPRYWVRDKDGYAMLYKTPKGYITSTYYDVNYEEQLSNKELYTFTEEEIEEYDGRYLAFVIPVVEE